MTLRAVAFDLGGTLVHHSTDFDKLLRAAHQSMRDYLAREGVEVELDDLAKVSNEVYSAYSSFAEKSLIELDARILYSAILYKLDIADYSNEGLISGTINSFYGPIVDDYHIFNDVKEVLGRLADGGLRLGLVTNNQSTDFHLRLLARFDLRKFFDAIVVSSELGVRKPHKRAFLHCLRELGVRSMNAVFVGDDPLHDVQGAKNVGMRCIWVKRREYEEVPAEPNWTVESISEAGEIIAHLQ
ncbi:MAG: HAD family hydrolase [Candidatus Bathyarchaeota archaeon]|nr:HAD family hydrolase [Candidatus Bathyarchaeota archaeon]MDH5688059.1 HAD family hydrolase [Candidatus Bathyarchaeota archaeon]